MIRIDKDDVGAAIVGDRYLAEGLNVLPPPRHPRLGHEGSKLALHGQVGMGRPSASRVPEDRRGVMGVILAQEGEVGQVEAKPVAVADAGVVRREVDSVRAARRAGGKPRLSPRAASRPQTSLLTSPQAELLHRSVQALDKLGLQAPSETLV
jgi:hypothetical protein